MVVDNGRVEAAHLEVVRASRQVLVHAIDKELEGDCDETQKKVLQAYRKMLGNEESLSGSAANMGFSGVNWGEMHDAGPLFYIAVEGAYIPDNITDSSGYVETVEGYMVDRDDAKAVKLPESVRALSEKHDTLLRVETKKVNSRFNWNWFTIR